MTTIADKSLKLEWRRCPDGYRIESRKDEPGGGRCIVDIGVVGGTFLVPCSDQLELVPLDGPNPKNPVALAVTNIWAAADRLEAILKVAGQFGLPTEHHEANVSWFDRTAETLLVASSHARCHGFRELLQWLGKVPKVEEAVDPKGVLFRRPRTLEAFVWAEFLSLTELGREFRPCDYCQNMFVSAIKLGERKEGFRFCPGQPCKTLFYNSKEGQARQEEVKALKQKVRSLQLEREEAAAAAVQGVRDAAGTIKLAPRFKDHDVPGR